ncbi:MAG: hypothetical protein IJP62_09735 [Treponema sp.]|nr:hypothetical protein [Treponema sp.]
MAPVIMAGVFLVWNTLVSRVEAEMSGANCSRGGNFPLKILIFSLSLLFSSCMTMADYNYSRIDSNLAAGKYADVAAELTEKKTTIYGMHDEVLTFLDAGLVAHYDNRIADSNANLGQAETLMEKYGAKSVSQSILSMVTNDLVQDYAGEDFENIYANVFMALNYLRLGEQDEAMVEIRRFDNKLKTLRSKYEGQIHDFEMANEDAKVKKVSIQFHDSALARYLSMILYRADGDADNAAVDYKYLKSAFDTQKDLYNFDIPMTAAEEAGIGKSKARLNVLAFSGLSPIKKEKAVRAYSWEGTVWYKLALPVMERRSSSVSSVLVTATDKASGERFTQKLELLESLENICEDTFQQKYSILYARALARSIAKTAANTTMHVLSNKEQKEKNMNEAIIFSLLDFATKITNEVTERADVRTCRYFPAKASVAGITLPPGEYTVSVQFLNGRKIVHTETKEMSVRAGKLNFFEATCLK